MDEESVRSTWKYILLKSCSFYVARDQLLGEISPHVLAHSYRRQRQGSFGTTTPTWLRPWRSNGSSAQKPCPDDCQHTPITHAYSTAGFCSLAPPTPHYTPSAIRTQATRRRRLPCNSTHLKRKRFPRTAPLPVTRFGEHLRLPFQYQLLGPPHDDRHHAFQVRIEEVRLLQVLF